MLSGSTSRATTPDQKVVVTTLDQATAASRAVEPPALVVVGDVVRLRPALDWLGAMQGRPLKSDPLGTRSRHEAV